MHALSTQTYFVGDSLVSSPAQPLEDGTTPLTSGPNSGGASVTRDQLGLSLKMYLGLAMTELSGCAAIWRHAAIGCGRLKSILRHHSEAADALVSSGWPTPTAKANHDAPSMAKWPAYKLYHATAGRTTPRLWEWMMGFPAGWTDCTSSGMPSLHTRQKSSGARS